MFTFKLNLIPYNYSKKEPFSCDPSEFCQATNQYTARLEIVLSIGDFCMHIYLI